jgi:hypothetical protein
MASSPMRMPTGRNEPKPPCTLVSNVTHCSGVSAWTVEQPKQSAITSKVMRIAVVIAIPSRWISVARHVMQSRRPELWHETAISRTWIVARSVVGQSRRRQEPGRHNSRPGNDRLAGRFVRTLDLCSLLPNGAHFISREQTLHLDVLNAIG